MFTVQYLLQCALRKVLLSHFNSLLPTSFSNRDRGLTTCGPTYFTTSSFFYCVPEKAINEVGILAIALFTSASFTTSQCIKIPKKSLIFTNIASEASNLRPKSKFSPILALKFKWDFFWWFSNSVFSSLLNWNELLLLSTNQKEFLATKMAIKQPSKKFCFREL